MNLLCAQLSSRLSTALDHARADARMGRSVNVVAIEQVSVEYAAEIVRLAELAERLRRDLAWYADPENWKAPESDEVQGVQINYASPAEEDGGDRARSSLA